MDRSLERNQDKPDLITISSTSYNWDDKIGLLTSLSWTEETVYNATVARSDKIAHTTYDNSQNLSIKSAVDKVARMDIDDWEMVAP